MSRFISKSEVRSKTALSDTTRYMLERAGAFPRRITITPRRVVWDEAEIDAWMAERKANPANQASSPIEHRQVRA
jgi:prophage regulatory protein